jgi:hypothetical protein
LDIFLILQRYTYRDTAKPPSPAAVIHNSVLITMIMPVLFSLIRPASPTTSIDGVIVASGAIHEPAGSVSQSAEPSPVSFNMNDRQHNTIQYMIRNHSTISDFI